MTTNTATNALTAHCVPAVVPSDRRFGVEVETSGLSQEAVAKVAAKVLGGVPTYIGGTYRVWSVNDSKGRAWNFVYDSSIFQSGRYSGGACEIVTPILSGAEDVELLQSVVRVVKKAGAVSDTAHGCGVHVHVDGAGLSSRDVANLATVVYKYQGLLYKALGAECRQQWCRVLPEDVVTGLRQAATRATSATSNEMNVAWYGRLHNYANRDHYDGLCNTRYRGLNLHSLFFRGTVEFRYFNGTLHAGEIKSYVQFCLALVVRAQKLTSPRLSVLPVNESSRFYFRTFLKDLGMTGDGYAAARLHLTKNLEGPSSRLAA